MFRKWRNKLLAGLTAVACSFGMLGVWAQNGFAMPAVGQAMAETAVEEPTVAPEIEIVSKNLSYADSVYILYAVAVDGFDESQNEVQMLFWNSLQTEYTVETAESVKRAEYTTTLGEKECIVFYSDGIAAKEMNDMVYCRAYAEVDGEAVYSDVEKYSVVDYVYEKRAEGNLTANQTAVFADMLDYGSSAQKLFGYNTDKLANATYYTVTVENGTLEDGFTYGRYAKGEKITLTALPEKGGFPFIEWSDGSDWAIGYDELISVGVYGDKTYTALYGDEINTPISAFTYTSNGSEITITDYVGGYEYSVVKIPSIINGLPVTTIGAYAFYSINLSALILPSTIKTIESNAFERLYVDKVMVSKDNEYYMMIDENIYTKDGKTFVAYITYDSDFVIPEGVTAIADSAFFNEDCLNSVLIPNTVTTIGKAAFGVCAYLENVNIPPSVTNIGEDAFTDCSSLTSVVIPDSVTSIGDGAFSNCSSLTSVEIPGGVTSIGKNVFNGCSGLTSVIIFDGVMSIGSHAFAYCSSLKSVKIPNSMRTIGKYAFAECSALTSVVIPNGVVCIETFAFRNCSSLISVEIPKSVTSIGVAVFYCCNSLTTISVDEENVLYRDIEGNLYTKDGAILIQYAIAKSETKFIIPDGVTSIDNYAFYGCSGLMSVEIPDGVTSIGNYAFQNCSSLTSVVIPDSVTSIGNQAFRDCSSLTSAEIPDSVTSIGEFMFYGCSNLTSVEISDSVTSIGNYAFSECSNLTSVVIPDSVTSIGRYAFSGCSSLTSVVIPDSVTSIGNYAFSGCSSLTICCEAESLPEGWNAKWNSSNCPVVWGYKPATDVSAFTYTSDGSSVTITKYVGEYTEVVIPSTIDGLPVTKIGDFAFDGCNNLTSVIIPDSVTSIGDSAFRGCGALTSVVIPDGVTSIGVGAFEGCSSLTIYCMAESQPNGWDSNWNSSNCPVEWGYKGE